MDNFQWPAPESLPEDMRGICWFNGISWVHDYQEACVSKVEDFLKYPHQPSSAPPSLPMSRSVSVHGASTVSLS
jgi:hypothetical protein